MPSRLCPPLVRYNQLTMPPCSQGSSGTDWAAAFMFSLLPPTVDILLWEMAINDWHTADLSKSGMATSLAYQQLAELFLRRALALNPAMVVGFVHLWKVGAASCWPHCEKKGLLVQAQLQVLRAYSFLDLFVLDCSAMFEAFRVPAGWLFEDAHHPSPSAHIAIAGGLLRHMLPFVLQMQHDPSSRDRSGQLAVLPARMPSVAFPPPSAAELDQVLLVRVLREALLDVSRSIPSISYSLPTFGGNASLLSDEGAGDTGMLLTPDGAVHYENRSDYKREVSLPLCGAAQGTTLRYRVRGAGTQFVGISLRGATKAKHTLLPARPVLGLPHENVSALLRVHIRNALQPESAPPVLLQPLPEELMRAHFPVLIRGTLAPQAWFSVPGIAARAPAPSGPTQVEELVSLCATVGRLMVITAVGGVVFV